MNTCMCRELRQRLLIGGSSTETGPNSYELTIFESPWSFVPLTLNFGWTHAPWPPYEHWCTCLLPQYPNGIAGFLVRTEASFKSLLRCFRPRCLRATFSSPRARTSSTYPLFRLSAINPGHLFSISSTNSSASN
jgi:hypothetical protein